MASAASFRHYPHSACGILVVCSSNREGDPTGQSTEARSSHSYCILQPYILYGQTGVSSSVSSCEDFAKNFQKRRGFLSIQMAKLNIDRATVRQLFKTVVKASDGRNLFFAKNFKFLKLSQKKCKVFEFFWKNGKFFETFSKSEIFAKLREILPRRHAWLTSHMCEHDSPEGTCRSGVHWRFL